jgi:hypothetical protein
MVIYLPEIFPIKESLEFKFDNLILIAARYAVNTRYVNSFLINSF